MVLQSYSDLTGRLVLPEIERSDALASFVRQ